MNKIKPTIAAVSRVFLSVFMVVAMIVLASLIGVGGAALWIYSRSDLAPITAKRHAPQVNVGLVADDARALPKLTPVRMDADTPAQLTPAHYIPSESEIATVSDSPRYTYISYNGGRQQAHLRVNTVTFAPSAPAPLAPAVVADESTVPPPSGDRTFLADPASHYITNAQGRVIGIDGTAGAATDARDQQVIVARAQAVQPKGFEPEVRVASPVVVRRATPVEDDGNTAPETGTFSVQDELSREEMRPVLHAEPVIRVTHAARPSMFGASDEYRSFGRN